MIIAAEWLPLVLTPITIGLWLLLGYVIWPKNRTPAEARRHQRRWRRLRARVRNLLSRYVTYRLGVATVALVTGAVIAAAAPHLTSTDELGDFFSTVAQILPAFLIALAVDQRLSQGLGPVAAYRSRAEHAFDAAQSASIADENLEHARALEYEDEVDEEFDWVWGYVTLALYGGPDDYPNVSALARRRHRLERRGSAAFILVSIVSLLVGEAAAVLGTSTECTSTDGALFRLTAGAFVSSTLLVVLGGSRDLIRGLRREI